MEDILPKNSKEDQDSIPTGPKTDEPEGPRPNTGKLVTQSEFASFFILFLKSFEITLQ